VQQTTDGGYIITGHRSFGYYNSYWNSWQHGYDAVLIKTDTDGNMEWDLVIDDGAPDLYRYNRSYSVLETADNEYIITGYTNMNPESESHPRNYDAWLIKVDSQGSRLWTKTFGGSSGDYAYSVDQTLDGGYIITGKTYSFDVGWGDIWLIKTDSEGNTSE
jgi:hypothetical protein